MNESLRDQFAATIRRMLTTVRPPERPGQIGVFGTPTEYDLADALIATRPPERPAPPQYSVDTITSGQLDALQDQLAEALLCFRMASAMQAQAEQQLKARDALAAQLQAEPDPALAEVLAGFPRGFRLHARHRVVLPGVVFPSGYCLVVEDPEHGPLTAAASLDDLIRGYPDSRVEWPPVPKPRPGNVSARQAAGQPAAGCVCDTRPEECTAIGAKPNGDPTIADDPTPLRWGLNDVLHGDDHTVTICMSGPDSEPYWLELDTGKAAALRDDLAGPDAPAVGQPDAIQPDLPHAPYITAVVDALTAAGLEPDIWWISDAETDPYATGPDAGCATMLNAVISWDDTRLDEDDEDSAEGLFLFWDHPAEQWQWARPRSEGGNTEPEFLPKLGRYSDPDAVAATARALLTKQPVPEGHAPYWHPADAVKAAVEAWEREERQEDQR
ncbi:hypothetical protein [Streptomyces sp. NPDC093111]|uniref:hypothetical protein n=1 Tax=Streptomyces sp. NPDC093111 TaxID=3154978 RepID=UPI0034271E47